MKYIYANQMASPEGTEIFLKQKVIWNQRRFLTKFGQNNITDLGEFYIEYLLEQ